MTAAGVKFAHKLWTLPPQMEKPCPARAGRKLTARCLDPLLTTASGGGGPRGVTQRVGKECGKSTGCCGVDELGLGSVCGECLWGLLVGTACGDCLWGVFAGTVSEDCFWGLFGRVCRQLLLLLLHSNLLILLQCCFASTETIRTLSLIHI